MNTKSFGNALSLLLVLTFIGLPAPAIAQDTVFGEGRTPMGAGDAASIRNAAKQAAIRDAVITAIKDATALDASAPRFAPIVNDIAKQLSDVQVSEERREGADFVTRIQAVVDLKEIKNAIRGTDLDKSNDRSFSILMLVDEFVTSTQNLNMPLSVLVESNYDKGSTFKNKSLKASASAASSKSALAASSSENAAAAAASNMNSNSSGDLSAQGNGASLDASERRTANGSAAAASSYSANSNIAAAASSQSSNLAINQKDIDAQSHLKASYRSLVKYQDTSKPSSKSIFLDAFAGDLRDYDMHLLDSSIARSNFFGDKPITLSVLQNSAEMSKFAEYARTKANADFLMMGNSTVIDGGKNPATGQISCAVNATIKAFATAGSELIASETQSTQASAMDIEACATIASKKIADLMAPRFAGLALGYWTDRAARGRQYTVELKGSELPVMMQIEFTKALRSIQGVSDVEKKESSDSGVKVTLTYKGKDDAADTVYEAVASEAAFAGKNLDRVVVGDDIALCIDKCGKDAHHHHKKN